jgi:hypothetical protein
LTMGGRGWAELAKETSGFRSNHGHRFQIHNHR